MIYIYRTKFLKKNLLSVLASGFLLLAVGHATAAATFKVNNAGTAVINLTNETEMLSLEPGQEPDQLKYTYTVNMVPTMGTLENVTGNVTINARRGDNKITISGVYEKTLSITTNRGNDEILLMGVEVGNDLRINTGAGDDSVESVGLLVVDDTTINTAGGNDNVSLTALMSGDLLKINTGSGDDNVDIADSEVVTLRGNSVVTTGSGDDTAAMNNVIVTGRISVVTGAGNDNIGVKNSSFAAATKINSGAGDDDVTVIDNTFSARAEVNGSAGKADVYRDDDTNQFNGVSVNRGFESLDQPAEDAAISLSKQVSLTGGEPFFDANAQGGADVPEGEVGADATYRLIVTNIGGENLINVSISDPTLGLVNVPVPGGPIAPGDQRVIDSADAGYSNLSVTNRCDSAGNKVNVASVNAVGENFGDIATDSDAANVSCTATTVADPQCALPYQTISDLSRSVDNLNSTGVSCDRNLVTDWYRFTGAAGTRIPEVTPPINRCDTHAPGWMNGSHPGVADGVQSRNICYNWNGNSCNWQNTIDVVNCGDFMLYQLQASPVCHLRYCVTD